MLAGGLSSWSDLRKMIAAPDPWPGSAESPVANCRNRGGSAMGTMMALRAHARGGPEQLVRSEEDDRGTRPLAWLGRKPCSQLQEQRRVRDGHHDGAAGACSRGA